MKDIKLIAIDLDGTLLNDNKEISPENQAALQAAVDHGIKIVISTGRSLQGVEAYLDKLPQAHGDEFIILNNGATTLLLPELKMLQAHFLSDEIKEAAYNYSQAFLDRGLQLTAFDIDHYYLIDAHKPSPAVLLESQILSMPIQYMDKIAYQEAKLLKLVILGETEMVSQYMELMPAKLRDEANVLRSLNILTEFLPQGVSKGQALKELSQILGLETHQVMAIGDERNDIAMLNFAGYGVAMANAHPDLKSMADDHTASNNNHGVAEIIHKILSFVNK